MAKFHSFCGWVISLYIYHIFFFHSSVDGWHLGCFYFLAIVNNAAVSIEVHISFQINVLGFFGYIPRSGIAGSYGSSVLVFWGTSVLFSIVVAQTYNPISLFPTCSPIFVICRLFDDSHSDRCEMISHYGFDLHFFDD